MFEGHLFTTVVAEEPRGERLGPVIFWPLLILLLGVIAWSLYRRSRPGQAGAPRAKGSPTPAKNWTRPEDYREHHRVVWEADAATFAPTAAHWPLAVAAVFGICTGDPWDRLEFRNLDNPRSGLQEAWGIRSRPQLLSRLHWILREGHRVNYDREVAAWAALDDAAAAEILRQLRGGTEEEREAAWRLQQVRDDARGIREVNFEAWDLVRAAMLARAGYSLGWLSEAETVDTLNLLSAQLQRGYSCWQQLGEHFMRARWYWGGGSGLEAQQENAHDSSRQTALLDPQDGPWAHVPWTQPIPDSRVLLADALVAEGLIEEAPLESPTPLARVIDAVVAERLAERP